MNGRALVRLIAAAVIAAAASAGLALAGAPSGGDFVISRSTVDAGGGVSAGGDFVVTGTIGQPEAQPGSAAGKETGLAGGFWARVTDSLELIFKDGFEAL